MNGVRWISIGILWAMVVSILGYFTNNFYPLWKSGLGTGDEFACVSSTGIIFFIMASGGLILCYIEFIRYNNENKK